MRNRKRAQRRLKVYWDDVDRTMRIFRGEPQDARALPAPEVSLSRSRRRRLRPPRVGG